MRHFALTLCTALLTALLGACNDDTLDAAGQTTAHYAQLAVAGYCQVPEPVRLEVRRLAALATAPNTVAVHCAGDTAPATDAAVVPLASDLARYVALAVSGYCLVPQAGRLALREAVAGALVPNRIAIGCALDGAQ